MDLVYYPDERLFVKTHEVNTFDNELRTVLNEMIATMETNYGIGLAAPQVGRTERMFVVKTPEDAQARVFINPVILETSAEQWEYSEGCLSIPDIYAPILRSESITLQAQDAFGKKFTLVADELLGRVIFHEYDHLEGILFIDHLSEQLRQKTIEQYNTIER